MEHRSLSEKKKMARDERRGGSDVRHTARKAQRGDTLGGKAKKGWGKTARKVKKEENKAVSLVEAAGGKGGPARSETGRWGNKKPRSKNEKPT